MHSRALSSLLAGTLLGLVLHGCGGDTSLTDAGRQDASSTDCSIDNGGCSTTPLVTCNTNESGDAVCGPCPTGYSGDGRTCSSVTQVNECALQTDNCSTNATCTDTVAAFTCTCAAGYVGDGVVCAREGCTEASDCDDEVSCTNDTCGDSGNCIHTPVPALCPVGSSCNLATGCMAGRICGSHADCEDADPCTRNETCNPVSATCTFTVLDNDADGEPPLVCGGTDCNDADDEVGARVPERCGNLVDDDCNGVVDTDATVDSDPSLRSDESNCGACGSTCAGADRSCDQGQCVTCGQSLGSRCCNTECTSATSCVGGSCPGANLDCGITGGTAECVSCGGTGQRCCNDGAPCQVGRACGAGSTCVACGAVGQPCCWGQAQLCGGGATCADDGNACVACGGLGQPCCLDDTCTSPNTYCGWDTICMQNVPYDGGVDGGRDGAVYRCGEEGDPCCEGATPCAGGLDCSTFEDTNWSLGFCHSPTCGGSEEVCCRGLSSGPDSCVGDPFDTNSCQESGTCP